MCTKGDWPCTGPSLWGSIYAPFKAAKEKCCLWNERFFGEVVGGLGTSFELCQAAKLSMLPKDFEAQRDVEQTELETVVAALDLWKRCNVSVPDEMVSLWGCLL